MRKLDLASGLVTTIAGDATMPGNVDSSGVAARFQFIRALALSPDGTFLLLSDEGNRTLRRLDLATMAVTTLAGDPQNTSGSDGIGPAAGFRYVTGIAITPAGTAAYLADGQRLRMIQLATNAVTTVAGIDGVDGGGDGTGTLVRFRGLGSLAMSTDGAQLIMGTATSVRGFTTSTAQDTDHCRHALR